MGKPAVIKTKVTTASVEDFINQLPDEQKRKDSFVVLKMMEKAMKVKAKLWGTSIVGFGEKRYKSPASGREVDWFIIGFAPRKSNLSLHLTLTVSVHKDLLEKLGKHKTGVGCLYINKLEDVDVKVLEEIIKATVKTK